MRRVILFALLVVMLPMSLTSEAVAAEQVAFDAIATKDTDVEVFMLVGATDRQIDRVARAVESSRSVRRYAHLDQRDAFAEFERIFRRNRELVESMRAGDMPESFRLQLRDGADEDRVVRRFDRMPGVESVVTPDVPDFGEVVGVIRMCERAQDTDFEVFMEVGASPAEVDATRAAILAEPDLTIADEVSTDEAYEQFLETFARNEELLAKVDAADLPMSFRVRATTTPSRSLLDRLQASPGVASVETPAVCDDIRALLATGLTAEQIANDMIEGVDGTPT